MLGNTHTIVTRFIFDFFLNSFTFFNFIFMLNKLSLPAFCVLFCLCVCLSQHLRGPETTCTDHSSCFCFLECVSSCGQSSIYNITSMFVSCINALIFLVSVKVMPNFSYSAQLLGSTDSTLIELNTRNISKVLFTSSKYQIILGA